MIEMQPLTKRQREVYDFLCEYIAAHGYAPTLDEIGAAMGLSSLATVHKHLEVIRHRGYIRRGWNRPRFIELAGEPNCCPMCGRALEKIDPRSEVSR